MITLYGLLIFSFHFLCLGLLLCFLCFISPMSNQALHNAGTGQSSSAVLWNYKHMHHICSACWYYEECICICLISWWIWCCHAPIHSPSYSFLGLRKNINCLSLVFIHRFTAFMLLVNNFVIVCVLRRWLILSQKQ